MLFIFTLGGMVYNVGRSGLATVEDSLQQDPSPSDPSGKL